MAAVWDGGGALGAFPQPERHPGRDEPLFDSFFGRPATLAAAERMWAPLTDMYETKEDLFVTLELPGVREKGRQRVDHRRRADRQG
jgi:HSP20 family molecular chaperone IbpA